MIWKCVTCLALENLVNLSGRKFLRGRDSSFAVGNAHVSDVVTGGRLNCSESESCWGVSQAVPRAAALSDPLSTQEPCKSLLQPVSLSLSCFLPALEISCPDCPDQKALEKQLPGKRMSPLHPCRCRAHWLSLALRALSRTTVRPSPP